VSFLLFNSRNFMGQCYSEVSKDTAGDNLLRAAMYSGNVEQISGALGKGGDVNLNTYYIKGGVEFKTTPLIWAIKNNHFDLFLEILDKQPDVNLGSDPGSILDEIPLYFAVKAGIKYAEKLLELGADPNGVSFDDHTALHAAAETNDRRDVATILGDEEKLAICKALIKAGADVTIENGSGKDPSNLATNQDLERFLQLSTTGEILLAMRSASLIKTPINKESAIRKLPLDLVREIDVMKGKDKIKPKSTFTIIQEQATARQLDRGR
jgi:ankyrin repeat protein